MASLVLLFAVACVAFVTLKCFYNVYLHPLRSYPGPWLARACIIPCQRNLWNGRMHLWIQEVHKKYGPVVRLSPNELSFLEPEVWKDVYGHRASQFQKSFAGYGPDHHGDPPGIIRADNLSHGRQRKLVSHAFSDKALRDQEPLIKKYIEILVEKLQDMAAKDLKANLVEWYNYTTFDIMADLTFGESLHQLDGSDYHPWVRAIFAHIKLVSMSRICREWPGLTQLVQYLLPRDNKEKRKQHLAFSSNMIEKRLARKTDRPDIWTFVARNAGEDGGLQRSELYSNASLFMLAGTETTATELSGLTFLLLKNPEKLKRLTHDIRSTFTSAKDITMNKLAHLDYLGACIEEGLRLYPPVPTGILREVPKGGATVCGQFLPGGTVLQAPQYALYRSSLNFKDPEDFVPERFLPEGRDTYGSDRRDALNPFSTGPRNCLGKNLAYHEMRLVLATVLLNFDFELCDQETNWLAQESHLLWNKTPLMVKVKAANPVA